MMWYHNSWDWSKCTLHSPKRIIGPLFPNLTLLRSLWDKIRFSEHVLVLQLSAAWSRSLLIITNDHLISQILNWVIYKHKNMKHSQATALVCDKVRKVSQGKAVSKVKKCHGACWWKSAPCAERQKNKQKKHRFKVHMIKWLKTDPHRPIDTVNTHYGIGLISHL